MLLFLVALGWMEEKNDRTFIQAKREGTAIGRCLWRDKPSRSLLLKQ
jgi:hypothetical protein